MIKNRPINKNYSERGQSIVEAIFSLPLLLILFGTFFGFIYQQIWQQLIEHILHETLVCEKTIGEKFCLINATKKANNYNLIGKVVIYKSYNEYFAELILLGKFEWTTISVKESLEKK